MKQRDLFKRLSTRIPLPGLMVARFSQHASNPVIHLFRTDD